MDLLAALELEHFLKIESPVSLQITPQGRLRVKTFRPSIDPSRPIQAVLDFSPQAGAELANLILAAVDKGVLRIEPDDTQAPVQ